MHMNRGDAKTPKILNTVLFPAKPFLENSENSCFFALPRFCATNGLVTETQKIPKCRSCDPGPPLGGILSIH